MKKRLIAVTCAVLTMLSLSMVGVDIPNLQPFSVDVVSAATGTATSTTNASLILRLGSRGNEVKVLQTKLNEHGYILEVDGIFGKLTLNAVKSFQSKNGLIADGKVGPKTFEKLYAEIPVSPEPPVTTEPPTTTTPDAVTSASIVNNEADFLKAVSVDGTWIACTLNDLTINQEIVLEGAFVNKEKPARKIALYTQDADHNVLERFTLTAPKLVVRSENARIQGGTFVGDVYVEANGFTVRDAKVEGNVYFANEEYKSTFDASNQGVVTGVTEIKENVDVVTSASIVNNEAGFLKAISTEGTWIACALNDLTFDQEIVLEGGFVNKEQPARKIALYTQDADHNVLERFTLTAPKLVVRSENARIQGGTFVGDVYVEANGFTVRDAKVEGNVYFANEEYKSTFDASNNGVVTGVIEVKEEVDVVTSASIVDNKAAFINAISKDGTWIACTLNNLTFDQELVLEGEFINKEKIARKIALYTQDADHNRTASFTLIAPKLVIRSENARIQGGTFIGDVYVEANGFNIRDAKVEGNVYFANEEYKSTFDASNNGVVTGVIEVKTN